jgi:hypothetical protein
MSGSGEGELRRHLEGACICNEIARERVQGADTRRLQWADERVRCLHAAEPEGRDAGGAGSAPYEESLSSARFSATAASLSTAPSDAGSSGARENSAPIVTSRIPSPKSSRGPFIALCVHKLPREDVLGEVLTRQRSAALEISPKKGSRGRVRRREDLGDLSEYGRSTEGDSES